MSSGKWRPFCLGLNELTSEFNSGHHIHWINLLNCQLPNYNALQFRRWLYIFLERKQSNSCVIVKWHNTPRVLDYWNPMTTICVNKMGYHWFTQWLATCRCRATNWTNGNILPFWPLKTMFSDIWNKMCYQENVFENDVCKKATILFRAQGVHSPRPSDA